MLLTQPVLNHIYTYVIHNDRTMISFFKIAFFVCEMDVRCLFHVQQIIPDFVLVSQTITGGGDLIVQNDISTLVFKHPITFSVAK